MAFVEVDNCFLRALRYMHSSSTEARNNLWSMLDEVVKNKYGSGKELGLVTNYQALIREIPVVALSTTTSTETVVIKDDDKTVSSDNDLELDLLKEDLACVVCKGMSVGVRNRLVECTVCHHLYHQECHKPIISEEEFEASVTSWTCADCKESKTEDVSVATTTPSPSVVEEPTTTASVTTTEETST